MMSIIKKYLVVSMIMFFGTSLLWVAVDFIAPCKGWECETVYCPDKYAVKLPDGRYLPCEAFEAYVDGDASKALAAVK